MQGFACKVVETAQAHIEISNKYNEPKSSANLIKSENARLSKSLKAAKATFYIRETELKQIEWQAEYYKDKSSSIEMYTTVKVRAEMLKEYTKGKSSSLDSKAAFKDREKMKMLYSESKG